jgi:uncharacterized protein (TIGR00297 family)
MVHVLWIAGAVTLAFAVLARLLRGVTTSGAFAGAAICFVLYACAGPGAFVALVSVFILTWGATRLGYQRKQRLGVAEKRDGRNASQVLANLAMAGLCAGLYPFTHRAIYLIGVAAALSEAAADTVSSEIGQAGEHPAHLITTWERVPAGTDGGISWVGTAAGLAAAVVVSFQCVPVGLLNWRQALVAAVAGFGGMLADSYMGAVFERQHKLNNNLVNLLSTAIAVGIALLWGSLAP